MAEISDAALTDDRLDLGDLGVLAVVTNQLCHLGAWEPAEVIIAHTACTYHPDMPSSVLRSVETLIDRGYVDCTRGEVLAAELMLDRYCA